MAGFNGCPFLEKARQLVKDAYDEKETMILDTKEEFVGQMDDIHKHVMELCQRRLWGSLKEKGGTYTSVMEYTGRCKEQEAAIKAHKTCPLVWRTMHNELEFVGGCDDLEALLKKEKD